MTTWIWISGWAIAPDRFRSAVELAFPDDSHQVLAPTPEALEVALNSKVDRIGGYSLGSLILLSAFHRIPQTAKVFCLAPFISFCREDQLGGATQKATLTSLQQRLRKQPEKTLQLFYRLAGLDETLTTDLPYPIEHLEWGLEQLEKLKADPNALNHVTAIAGLQDPLLDANQMSAKGLNCAFVDQCNHNYQQLLVALSNLRDS